MHRSTSSLPLVLALLAPRSASAQEAPAIETPAQLLERLCADCHDGEAAERGVDLLALTAEGHAGDPQASARLALAVQRLRSRTMPPPDEAQPSAAERRALIAYLAARAPETAGTRLATLRRLTRVQIERSVQDLFGVTWSAGDLLPDDASAHGFTGIGDVQNLSPLHFEKLLEAADSIAALVLANAAARAQVLEDEAPLAARLPAFLARAWRRPVSSREAASFAEIFEELRSAGVPRATVERGLLRAIFASPHFLYRVEVGRADAPAELTAHELASRLSFLLRSSLPDEPLRARAEDGSLLRREVLVAEALRLVRLDGARRFAEDFAAEWLSLRDVLQANADFRRYPQIWNGALRPAFLEQGLRFCSAIAAENRSVLELLDSDSTFVDATLAKHYGLPPIEGGFQRVALSDRRRGGVLGMGAVLFATSYPLRTSPVRRGKWILEKLLDAPPPPPPPNAGTLPPDDQLPDGLSLRQRLERHRKERACAGCHVQMDALGFALENYDVLGLWRDQVNGAPVDALGTLIDGTSMDGPLALREELLLRADEFVRSFAKNLLVAGVGREMTLRDEPALAEIVAQTRASGDRFSALLEAVVTSPLFTRRDPGAP
ncbi:MAG: DUF1592 domain-containing protein [Planctomycetes bacterium]|nr:DUF1592 domain-containing protein [Planctomycetota bacterium]